MMGFQGGGMCTTCGGANQPCCAGDACTGGLSCIANLCQQCGSPGQPCCAGGVCNTGCCGLPQIGRGGANNLARTCIAPGASCGATLGACGANGSCGTCGAVGQVCCQVQLGGGGGGGFMLPPLCTASRSACNGAICGPCGGSGQPCCDGRVCNDGLTCNGGNQLGGGTCR
jgi:hypothetical protein